jgi:hypothetical protein
MTRRITQIAIDPTSEDNYSAVIYALCDDGSLWSLRDLPGKAWERLPGVPDEDGEAQ